MPSSGATARPPLVSLVIPCHRQARFLGEAIESVLAQTLPAHEIVVVDDCSPDEVEAVARRYPVVYSRLSEQQGVSRARNFGLEQCRGDFVVFLDADDRLLPMALEVGARALAARPQCAFVWGLRRLIDDSGVVLPGMPKPFSGPASYLQLLRRQVVGPPSGVMFRRSVCQANGGFAVGMQGAEDYELYLRLARHHEAFGHGEPVVEYRIHADNMSADPQLMLAAVMHALASQEVVVGGDRSLRRALAEGRRSARDMYESDVLLERLGVRVRAGRWGAAVVSALGLLVRYPRVFVPILVRRLTRTHRNA
jgi:glycosyltransferase involved in cell wall biosynthesis